MSPTLSSMILASPQPPSSAPHTLPPLICLSFHNTDMATGCRLVLMLLTTVLTSTGAVPVPTPLRTLPGARGCHMSQFKTLSPQELKAFKRAKDALVSLPTAPLAVG